jgi:hypothetical protein
LNTLLLEIFLYKKERRRGKGGEQEKGGGRGEEGEEGG